MRVYLEPYQKSLMKFFTNIIEDFKPLTALAKNLHHRCFTGLYAHLCSDFPFYVFLFFYDLEVSILWKREEGEGCINGKRRKARFIEWYLEIYITRRQFLRELFIRIFTILWNLRIASDFSFYEPAQFHIIIFFMLILHRFLSEAFSLYFE